MQSTPESLLKTVEEMQQAIQSITDHLTVLQSNNNNQSSQPNPLLADLLTTVNELKGQISTIRQATHQPINIMTGDNQTSQHKTRVTSGGDVTGLLTQSGTGTTVKRLVRQNKTVVGYVLIIMVALYGPEIKQTISGMFSPPPVEVSEFDDWVNRYD